MPEGRLDNFQRHKLRVYGTYAQGLGRFGSVDVAPLWRVNSGGVYSLTASRAGHGARSWRATRAIRRRTSARRRAQTVFFGERGAYEFKGYGVMDFATSYNVPVWKTVQPWVKLEVYNLFNNQKQIAWDRTVTRRRGQRARRQRHPDRLHPGPALRPGDGRHALRRSVDRPGRRPRDEGGLRRALLENTKATKNTESRIGSWTSWPSCVS